MAITVLSLAAGCASQPAADSRRDRAAPAPPGDRAAAVALEQVGTPYRYGGNGPTGFDCSGLVHYAWRQAGRSLPRTTTQLWRATKPVSPDELVRGDLLFFRIEGKMQHVGLYVGGRRFVHAPSSGRTVTVESLDAPFYREAFIRGGRP